jgi:hypothetical protein
LLTFHITNEGADSLGSRTAPAQPIKKTKMLKNIAIIILMIFLLNITCFIIYDDVPSKKILNADGSWNTQFLSALPLKIRNGRFSFDPIQTQQSRRREVA